MKNFLYVKEKGIMIKCFFSRHLPNIKANLIRTLIVLRRKKNINDSHSHPTDERCRMLRIGKIKETNAQIMILHVLGSECRLWTSVGVCIERSHFFVFANVFFYYNCYKAGVREYNFPTCGCS
jgi:hypothetical protein